MKRRPRIYLDTSVISAIFDSRNRERAFLTRLFWQQRVQYQVFVSDLVLTEIRRTSASKLRRQMEELIARLALARITNDVESLAKDYISHGAIPDEYPEDAYHIAIAVINEMDFLLSWNFRHIVRQRTREIVKMVNGRHGLRHVEILTPAELL
mgnify:CR=1 FL=1